MKPCECGCGTMIKNSNKFVLGHQMRKRPASHVTQQEPEVLPSSTNGESVAGVPPVVLPDPLKVYIWPHFGEEDNGDGGIRRVIEAQRRHLPKYGIEIVETPEEADLLAANATIPPTFPRLYPQKPIVSICHGLYWKEYEWENWAYKANAAVTELNRIADAIVVPSEWVANNVRRHLSRPVTVIAHGVDSEDWEPEEPLEFVLWNKTRPDPVCDPTPVNLVAELLPEIAFVTTFGRETHNVKVTGKLEFAAAKALIQKAGVYLCTSRETFGIGTLEAMACGVPIVGYNWGGQAEFIQHEVDGWLARPDDIEGLADGIRWALKTREASGEAARRKSLTFNWDVAAEKYAQVFKDAWIKKNTPRPRTSIIVTNYNLEKYLNDCLQSVADQTDKDWECIIVDDASPSPDGRKIALEWAAKDSRFKLIENKKNVYLAESRNIGIRASKGKYILPLDADDMLSENAVDALATSLDIERAVWVAYGAVFFVEEDGKTPTEYGGRFAPGRSGWPIQFSHENQIAQRNLLPYCSMYRREAWEYTGGYRGRNRTAEDAEMWTRFSSYGFRPKMTTNEDTLVYRNRPHSMSRSMGDNDWTSWFHWSKVPEITPAGAVTQDQLPVPSLDPIVISVIIPVGPGHEGYVYDAIDSVASQTFQNWECVVINDTGAPLHEMPPWVKVLETPGRTGPAFARNMGIRASNGRLFLPLDADDFLEPSALELMFNAYQESKEIIYSDFWQTDAEGKDSFTIYHCDDYDPFLLAGKKRTVDGEVRGGMTRSVTALTPKVAWEAVGGYDESLPAWEDWDFQLSLADKGYCERRIDAPLFIYRKHTGFRRDENYAGYEQSKEAIISKWGALWDGGKELMACRSCGGGSRPPLKVAPHTWGLQSNNAQLKAQKQGDATLVQYVGNKQGARPFRGKSGTTYWFGAGDKPKWVYDQDLEVFERYPSEFRIVQNVAEPATEPALQASGPPK